MFSESFERLIATNGGTLAYQKQAPTCELADKLLNDRPDVSFTPESRRSVGSGVRSG